MGHTLEVGDGILAGTATPDELKHICRLIDKTEGIKNYFKISSRGDYEWVEGNFMFNGKEWLTTNENNITNPLTYQEICDNLKGGIQESYEIY